MHPLLSILQAIGQQSRDLLDCLKQEKQALDSANFEQLSTRAKQKQVLVDELQRLDAQRSEFFTRFNKTDSNFNAFISDTQNSSLIKQWKLTQQSISECQQQNEINGRILHKKGQLNLDMLSIITGSDRQKSAQTYNAQGNQTNNASLFEGVKA